MAPHIFMPHMELIDRLPDTKVSVEDIHSEPMLFGADWNFARENGGPLTNYVMDFLKKEDHIVAAGIKSMIRLAKSHGAEVKDFHGNELDAPDEPDYNCIIDTRSHMLMKFMYPAIPGWHCDGVPRGEQYAQPDLKGIDPEVKFYTCILSSVPDVSRTMFIDQDMEIDVKPNAVWASVDNHMANNVSAYKSRELQEGEILSFDQNTLHTATPCVNPGWRFFFRLGLVPKEPQNKIRKQVQVYTVKGKGW